MTDALRRRGVPHPQRNKGIEVHMTKEAEIIAMQGAKERQEYQEPPSRSWKRQGRIYSL